MNACAECGGTGRIPRPEVVTIYERTVCWHCSGTGDADARSKAAADIPDAPPVNMAADQAGEA